MKVQMEKCKKKLSLLWFIGAGFLFLTLIAQTIGKFYGTKADEAWSWFLPTIMPTLSLIIGVFVIEATGKSEKKKSVDNFIYRLAFILSLVYLIIVALTIYISPFTSFTAFELMKTSNYWLGPLQGLVSAVIGIFFIKKEAD